MDQTLIRLQDIGRGYSAYIRRSEQERDKGNDI